MRRILRLPAILLIVPALFIAGATGGETLRGRLGGADPAPGAEAAPGDHAAGTADDPATAPAPTGEPTASAGAHAPGDTSDHGGTEGGGTAFPFPQQFFVPLVRDGAVRATMVLSLGVEIPEGREENVYRIEMRLRDALLRRLMQHANTGGFDGNFTSDVHLRTLREALLGAARSIAGDKVQAVLIGDIARKED